MEIPGRSPRDVRDLCLRREFKLSGLRVRLSGEHLRARYVSGPAASAPLLKAQLVPASTGTRVVGQVHWAAPIVYWLIYIGTGLLMGLFCLVAGIAQHAWQPEAIGIPLVLFFGWWAIDECRNVDEDRESHQMLFERALLEAFAHK